MLLILPLPERGIASFGKTINNEKGVYEFGRKIIDWCGREATHMVFQKEIGFGQCAVPKKDLLYNGL